VLYCLGITEIDPIRYGLLFERFLTTERVSLPDVDIDFADARRQEVIDYIRTRYGNDSVAQIITFGTMQARAAVRDVGRVMDIPIGEVDKLAKLIPPGMALAEAIRSVGELRDLVESRSDYRELWQIASKLEGLSRHASVHASAVVIAPQPLIELVPLAQPGAGEVCTQYDMYALEDIGLPKLDVLGLRTLTVVDEGARLVRQAGKELDISRLRLDDANTYRLIQRGDTVGVFQLESAGMRDLCRRMLPERIEHIIALIALYRPGPMELIPEYLARKAGTRPIEFEHPLLEQICRETYGIMIYQEQVMQAAQVLAGYTLGKADLLRRAMGKKLPAEMAAQREVFVEGCVRLNQLPRDKAERIFDLLAKFAGYGFNKSHAAGYAFLSYITAYLKANHPAEFLAASLTSELGDFKKLAKFINEARRLGIRVLGPDVNRSFTTFTIEGPDIRFGLAGIKNIGPQASDNIVKERIAHGPFASLLDFLMRNRGNVNRKAVESLIKAGAFDCLEPNRSRLLASLDRELEKAASERLRFQERQGALFELAAERPEAESARPRAQAADAQFDTPLLLAYEKEAFGFYFSSHPLEPFRAEYQALGFTPIGQLENVRDNTPVAVAGVITSRRLRPGKQDRQFLIATVEDFEGAIDVLVFSEQLESCQKWLNVDQVVGVQGVVRLTASDSENQAALGSSRIWASRVFPLTECGRFIKMLVLETSEPELTETRLSAIRQRLEKFPGTVPVFLKWRTANGAWRMAKLKRYQVRPVTKLLEELTAVLGPDRVWLEGELPRPAVPANRTRPLSR